MSAERLNLNSSALHSVYNGNRIEHTFMVDVDTVIGEQNTEVTKQEHGRFLSPTDKQISKEELSMNNTDYSFLEHALLGSTPHKTLFLNGCEYLLVKNRNAPGADKENCIDIPTYLISGGNLADLQEPEELADLTHVVGREEAIRQINLRREGRLIHNYPLCLEVPEGSLFRMLRKYGLKARTRLRGMNPKSGIIEGIDVVFYNKNDVPTILPYEEYENISVNNTFRGIVSLRYFGDRIGLEFGQKEKEKGEYSIFQKQKIS